MILGLLGAFAVWGLYWGGWSARRQAWLLLALFGLLLAASSWKIGRLANG